MNWPTSDPERQQQRHNLARLLEPLSGLHLGEDELRALLSLADGESQTVDQIARLFEKCRKAEGRAPGC